MDATPLFTLISQLRHPETGCPWDRQQTLSDLVAPLRNEVEELAEAIDDADAAHIREELGDVLFNVCMLLQVAEQNGLFAPGEAMREVIEKMMRRHPHVFGGESATTVEEAQARFQEAKRREKE